MQTIRKNVRVGIDELCQYVARIYDARVVVTSPTVKWRGNTGGYHEKHDRITAPEVVDSVHRALEDGAEDTAWQEIGRYLGDDYLLHSV